MNDFRKFEPPPVELRANPAEFLARSQGQPKTQRVAYSRFVLVMKFLLPSVALGLVALIVLWPQIYIDSSRFSIGWSRLSASGGEFPSMVNARFVGTDSKDQPFTVTADLAKSTSLDAAQVELEMPKADIGLSDGTAMMLTANSGSFDQQEKTLKLEGAVNLFHDSGYEFKTSAANVDFGAGTASGAKPVEGQGPFGHLEAEGFRIVDDGERLLFTGKAKLTILPPAQGAAQ